jgi:hypothetical protein
MIPILETLTTVLPQVKYGIAPLAIMAAAQAIPFVINTAKGISQGYKAKQLAKTPRPEYQIPDALIKSVNNAKYISSMRELPGQNLMEGRIGQNLSRGIQDLKDVSSSPAELAANVSRMYSGSNNAINDIGMAAGQNWLNNQAGFRQALGQLAGAQDRQWQINKFDPYANDMAASAALREGAFRNISAAGQNIASGISGYGNMKFMENLYGGGDNSIGSGTSAKTFDTGNSGNAPNISLGEAIGSANNMNGPNPNGGLDINAMMQYIQNRNNTMSPQYQKPLPR